jgi:trimeric autotransporter adhesin
MKFYFALYIALTLCIACRKKDTTPQPSITALNCASASVAENATAGIDYSGTITLPYDGGNGIPYSTSTPVASTGVTGLTATLQGDRLATFRVSLRIR